ncbi:MAG TPA: protein kinase [Polyangiaceae bacterium]|nr:protein kinase [Polyangiaceae bacterium]
MLREGQLVASRYRIERRIAQGGMSAVFAAEHVATEERVALKVLFPHVLGSKSAVESFQLEARVTARIDSEHIVRILDAGFDEHLGLPFLAMELLRGMTLRALVRETGALSPAEALAVLRQVAKALDKAHGYVDRAGRPAPIVHRDLKPENLFVRAGEGGAAFVKVLDFGIAKVLSESQLHSHEVKGTPLFMAREQFSHGAVTPQLDVWALGLIAFYALAGRIYWLSGAQGVGGVGALLNEILVQPLAPPSERALALGLTPAWPVEFDAWFLRCLEPDPRNRFASAGVAVEALVEVFAAGAGLNEADIGAAAFALPRRVALGLESLEAAAAVGTTLPPASDTRVVKTAELIAEAPSGSVTRPATGSSASMTAPPSSVATDEPLTPPAGARALGASARARVFGAMVALGGAMALAVGLATRSATRGEGGGTSASALASRSEPDAPASNVPPPSSAALAPVAASNAAPAPAPAEALTSARPSAVRAPSPARPPRAPGRSTKGAEAAKPKVGAGAVGGAPPPAEAKPPPKPSPSETLYNQP